MQVHLLGNGIRGREGERDAGLDIVIDARLGIGEVVLAGEALLAQPGTVECNRIALLAPGRRLVARAVVLAVDVAHMVAVSR